MTSPCLDAPIHLEWFFQASVLLIMCFTLRVYYVVDVVDNHLCCLLAGSLFAIYWLAISIAQL